ncbi:MAG: hypothetical protein Q4F67_15615 [Propionibacteriaceae bacterium]|nr:hypothetical protein [Propionibacteriaceae bacterium]
MTALTNDAAHLIVKEARITNDRESAKLLRDMWERQGYVVFERTEA